MKRLNDLAAEEKRAYMRAWRINNRDKVKRHQQNYWLRKAKLKLEKEGEENDSKNKDH